MSRVEKQETGDRNQEWETLKMQGDKIWAKGEDPGKMAEVRLTKCQSVRTNRPTQKSLK